MALIERFLKLEKDQKRWLPLEPFFMVVQKYVQDKVTIDELAKQYNFTKQDRAEWDALAAPAPLTLHARTKYFDNLRATINQAINAKDGIWAHLGIVPPFQPKTEDVAKTTESVPKAKRTPKTK
jgi:hypothetical protein